MFSFISDKSTLDCVDHEIISISKVLTPGAKGLVTPAKTVLLLCANNLFLVFKNSGASFSIAMILYLALFFTKISESAPFFNIKKVSSSTLFLSDDGNDNHKLPSSAL
ncbi:hypothetical protein [uncultured Mediterranean phage]|nr:hypothetical protein [uncultured Mediterranean phage]